MKTTTIEEEREINNDAHERITANPESVSGLSSRQRRRLVAVLVRREEIEDLASTQWQREAYGIEAWHRDFVRLRDARDHPHCTKTGQKLRQHLWNAIPNSRFRRFQEAFCKPGNFIVPAFDIDNKNRVTFRGNPDFGTMSLQPCLVSADCISEKLAKDLQLASFSDNTGKPFDRLKKKADPRVINGLKKIWESLMPLQSGAHRILSIQPPDLPARQTYPDPAVPDPSIVGRIIYTREAENGKEQAGNPDLFRQQTVMFFRDADSAYRKTIHEKQEYSHEIQKIAGLCTATQDLNLRLDREWKHATPAGRQQLTQEATDLTSHCIHELRGVENVFKVQAREYMTKIAVRFEASQKPNMSPLLSEMNAARTRFQRRYDDMYRKGGYNQQDHAVLEKHIASHKSRMLAYRKNVQDNFGKLYGFAENTNGSGTTPDADTLLLQMNIDPQGLRTLDLQPFTVYVRRFDEKYDRFSAAVRRREFLQAKRILVQMHVIGKFQGVRSCFETMKEQMTYSDRVPVSRIRDFVHDMREYFETYQVCPDVIVEEYRVPFENMKRALLAIEQALTRYANQDIDVGSRTHLYRMLKEYIEAFDIEYIVERLP